MKPPRIIAVDWSGAKTAAAKKIWRADVVAGRLDCLRNGVDAPDLARQLIDLAQHDPRMAVGFDFSFSMPAWFLQREGIASAPDLWSRVTQGLGERWLAGQPWPFWGRAGSRMPTGCELLRRADRALYRETGFLCKSVFQLVGAGSAGTGSLRGMPVLHALRAAGFHIWPYDDPGWPAVLEIYPRVFTGPVRKSRESARVALIEERYPDLAPEHRRAMASSDDAFDAAISALEMWRHVESIERLPRIDDPVLKLEGMVWHPGIGTVPAPVLAT
ncbi:MAG TPA: hypothetical protein VJP07_04665 [Dehalococcoidia bacterium]|nr:hypothetical protein [Dehalococcoidia bacterium]